MKAEQKKKNILCLVAVPRVCKGLSGGDKIILWLARYVNPLKYHVIIGLLQDSAQTEPYLLKEAKAYGLDCCTVLMRHKFDLGAIGRLRRVLKNKAIDILHCHGYKADTIGFLAAPGMKIRLLSTVHGWIGVNALVKLYDFFDKLLLRNFDAVVVVSGKFRQTLRRFGVPDRKLRLIYNGISEKDILPANPTVAVRNSLGIGHEDIVIGTVGRLNLEKGHGILLTAVEQIPEKYPRIFLLVVGDGPLLAPLRKQAEELGINDRVLFTGYRSDIGDLLPAMDIFVLPSLREGFPIVLLEAMMAGKPIVSTNVGDIPVMLEDGKTGLLVGPGNSRALSEKLTLLLENKELSRNLAKAAREQVLRSFTCSQMIKQYEQVYDGLSG